MRYNKEEFDNAVKYYKEILKSRVKKSKSIFVYGKFNKKAFFSIAPLSRAAFELGIDINVSFGYNTDNYSYLFDVWKTYSNLKNKKIGKKERALKEFLDEINIKEIEDIFSPPDLVLETGLFGFKKGIKYKTKWFVPFMAGMLKKTTDSIIKNVYGLKKNERMSIGFVVVPDKKFLSHPLQDYLDSYAIAYNMFLSAKKICKKISLGASTPRESFRDKPEKTSELATTLIGLELEKNIKQPVFEKYKKLSDLLNLNRIKISQASFFISGKGYHGKHYFGEKIGYPTLNNKTKWNSPGGIIYKFHWYPQSELEDRPPLSRLAFTSTVPIDKLIESAYIDYEVMRKRNADIAKVMNKCNKIIVKSNIKNGCDFEVGLIKKDGKRRMVLGSDSDVRTILNPIMLKKGKKMGRMANIPGGEAFTTPAYVKGKIVGDVVIHIDRSYVLKKPLIAKSTKKGYTIISGPKDVLKAFEKRKSDAWKNILDMEKNKSTSKEIIKLKKKNFNKIGEFAINTNPNAKLCDYLIINEKIANMIHVAFGSGFEPDASTEYHMDVVIDSPRQKLDIYGIDKKGKKHYIIKEGRFVI